MTWQSIYAVIGIPVIFTLSLVGAIIPPIVAHFFPKYGITQKLYFSFFNGLAAGLILAVGYVHSVGDSFGAYGVIITGDSLGEQYPWAAFVAMCGTLMCFTVEEFVDFLASCWGVDLAEHGHSHGTVLVNTLELKDVARQEGGR